MTEISDRSCAPVTSPIVRRRVALTTVQAYGVCLAMFLEGLSSSSINVQVAAVRTDLGLSSTELQLVASGFLVAYAGLLLPAGGLVDRLDRRRLFLLGLALFAVGTLAGAIAPSAPLLVAGRVVQGAGAAISAPAALALVSQGLPAGGLRNRRVALYGAMGAVGFSTGLVVPGFLVASFGWRSSFLVLLPCVAVVAALAWRVPAAAGGGPTVGSRLGRILPVEVLARARVRVAAATLGCAFAGVLSSILVLTLALQDWHGYGAFVTGLLVLPQPLCFALLSGLGARWTGAAGWRPPLLTGLALVAGAIAGLGWLSAYDLPPVAVVVAMALVGAGLALLFPAASIAAVDAVPEQARGGAAAVLTTAQNVGGALGIAVVTVLALVPVADRPGILLLPLLVPAGLVVIGLVAATTGARQPVESAL